MTELKQIYRCRICGNLIEILHAGNGQLVCCGESMKLINENPKEIDGHEKHVPVIEKTANGFKVKVGSIPHPMEEEHFIEFIELIANGVVYRKHLTPKDKPEAEFCIKASKVTAREYCNIHGLWKSK